MKATVPVGVDAVPATDVSFTKAVQLVPWATTIAAGEQVIVVDVVRLVTFTVLLVPELPLWALSVGV